MEINLETIREDGLIPYQKYLDGIKNEETKSHYNRYLHMFLKEIPDEIYQQFTKSHPNPTDENRANFL